MIRPFRSSSAFRAWLMLKPYSSPSNLKIPGYFMAELKKDKMAKAFVDTLNRAILYTISYRLETEKNLRLEQDGCRSF